MADEPQTAQTAPESSAAPSTETAAAPSAQTAQPGLITYVVKHRMLHDGREYLPGEAFQHADPSVTAQLRRAKAIVLQTEMQAADEVAARMAALEAQLLAAQQENARLQAERERAVTQNAPAASASNASSGGKSGK